MSVFESLVVFTFIHIFMLLYVGAIWSIFEITACVKKNRVEKSIIQNLFHRTDRIFQLMVTNFSFSLDGVENNLQRNYSLEILMMWIALPAVLTMHLTLIMVIPNKLIGLGAALTLGLFDFLVIRFFSSNISRFKDELQKITKEDAS